MMKILGFLACAVSLSLFSARYNAGWRRRAELICSLLDTVEHIRDRTAVFPDTQENIISEYAPKDAVGQAVKEALLAYYRTGEGEIIPKDLAPFADTADRECFLRFIKELGTGSLDDEVKRTKQISLAVSVSQLIYEAVVCSYAAMTGEIVTIVSIIIYFISQ